MIDSVFVGELDIDLDTKTYGVHICLWDNIKKSNLQYKTSPHDEFPRGRVIYNFVSDTYRIYADKCIDERILDDIKNNFGIKDKKVNIDKTDVHYVCRKCNKEFSDY